MEPINLVEEKFAAEIENKLGLNRYYTDAVLLRHAFHFIPFEELKVKATLRFSMLDDEQTEVNLEDCIVIELLHWFKNSFFTWFDAPKCELCSITAENRGVVEPNSAEAMYGASRVELYQCPKCQKHFRFPRYTDVKKLLQTRTGRCGEWASCFTLLCHALEYDVRLVYDFNDHVWCEVYSQARNKWTHCDPCENTYDKPLLYELGWKKRITYVIAFSPTEVQDVTWRYTTDFDKVLRQRQGCREEFVLSCIRFFQTSLEQKLDKDELSTLQYRRLMELADFLTPPVHVGDSYGGRSSGSMAWRLARGEVVPKESGYVFRLTPEEISRKRFIIKYRCADDKYVRTTSGLAETVGWNACVHTHSNVFRKVEEDWKMVYVSRTEGSPIGIISWKFDFSGSDLVISELRLQLHSETFENGKVTCTIAPNCNEANKKVYSSGFARSLRTDDLNGYSSFLLSVELTDGSGSNAWQHSQLFRQSTNSQEYPFEVEVIFDKNN
ncbi:hypothetical protein JTE90_028660 [Oedothorax gibbosus]|uniref:Peptide-N(4)-(N-acetyl-beta-glucosaminyl)asparagine amidase n=1 Tax=Oedothorax gibbosus TaxID=931172 RepID=A0AAV6V0Q0_9ARAC|nr:hypothetical protein JTE90_028660 [Oedothorax gibbosus]